MTPATVASWIDQGHLKGHRTPTGRRRVASADLADFLQAHGMAVPNEFDIVVHTATAPLTFAPSVKEWVLTRASRPNLGAEASDTSHERDRRGVAASHKVVVTRGNPDAFS